MRKLEFEHLLTFWVLLSFGISHVCHSVVCAEEPAPTDLQVAIRSSTTDPYKLNGESQPFLFDREALVKLRESYSAPAHEIAELRLGVDELRKAVREKREETEQAIIGGATVAAPLVSAALIHNAIAQLADGDDSLERQFNDSMGIVQSLEGLRQQVLQKQITRALIAYTGQLADHNLRHKLIATITPRNAAPGINTGFAPSWTPKVAEGVEVLRLKNTTGQTLHNVLIVLDLGVNKQLLNENEAAQAAVVNGLSLLMGIDTTQDNKYVLIRQAHGTINRGGSAFIPEWPANQSVEFPVSVIGMFAFRTESATLALDCDEMAFTGRSLTIQNAVTAAQKQMMSHQLKARNEAMKAAERARRRQ